MRLDEWRALLQVDDRKSSSDEDFWAICPCHSDHDASLHVTVGSDGGIRMKCFVCDAGNLDVAKALGKDPRDVMVDARTGEDLGRGRAAAADRPKREPKAPKLAERNWEKGKIWKLGKKGSETPYTLTQLYHYCRRDGTLKMQKARLEHVGEDGEKKKSFAFRHVGTDGRWYTGMGLYGGLLYGLELLDAAKEAGKTVYVVEGEKDADNLRALGYTAVSSAYGAGTSDKLERKWQSDYTKAMEGLPRVIVIPDNDHAGEVMARHTLKQLNGHVGELRVLWLSDSLQGEDAQKFKKGDFSDWAILRKEAGRKRREIEAEFDELSAKAAIWREDMPRRFEPEKKNLNQHLQETGQDADPDGGSGEDNGEPYYGMKNYSVKWKRLCKVDKNGATILCDFVPHPREVILRDDGQNVSTEYVIGATYRDQALPDAHVTPEMMSAMRWPEAVWPFLGNIRPIKGAREYVRDAIMRAGQTLGVKMRTVYGHTGMREVDGKMCYLSCAGSIGNENVSVALEGDNTLYTMETDVPEREGAQALEQMIYVFSSRILLPILAQAFLAPLYSEMERQKKPPSYVVYVVGRSNAYKSTLVGYVESMFGEFYARAHTMNFQSTVAAARRGAFLCKDGLYVIDDYNPEKDPARKRIMDAMAQAIITSVADRAARSTQDVSHKQRASEPARCTCIMTGEQLPDLNTGRQARLYVVDVAPGEIMDDARKLAPYERDANRGAYRAAMRGYITRLLARWDGMPREIQRRMDEAHEIAFGDETLPRDYARLLDAGKHLIMGCGLLIDYMIDVGVWDADLREPWMKTCWEAIRENILAQGDVIIESNPARVYLNAIRSMVRMRTVRVELLDDSLMTDARTYLGPGMVGYKDSSFYYFDPAAIDRAVRTMLKDRGEGMGQNAVTVRKMLLEQKLCWGDKTNPCRVKSIRGHQQRMLWIPRATIDGTAVESEPAPKFEPIPEDEQITLPFD